MQGLFADRFLKRFFRNRVQQQETNSSGGIVDLPENEVEPSGGSNGSSGQARIVKEDAREEAAEPGSQAIAPESPLEHQTNDTRKMIKI